MKIKEGLSFSDYFDDSVPADVKPPQMLCPMEEITINNQISGIGWLDTNGNYYKAEKYHEDAAEEYLKSKNILWTNGFATDGMYKLGMIRIVCGPHRLYFSYNRDIHRPTNIQLRTLKNTCIERHLELIDGFSGKIEDLDESDYPTQAKNLFKGLWEVSDSKSIFIEHMMPNDMDIFKSHLVQLFDYLKKELQLKTVPSVKLVFDESNAEKVLGKTAYYSPTEKKIVLYVTNRHQKDILRSFAHEVIHHWDHERGELNIENSATTDPQYTQNNKVLRKAEMRAYLLGNLLFRDWEDKKKAKDKKK